MTIPATTIQFLTQAFEKYFLSVGASKIYLKEVDRIIQTVLPNYKSWVETHTIDWSGNCVVDVELFKLGICEERIFFSVPWVVAAPAISKDEGVCPTCGIMGEWRPPAALVCPTHGFYAGF